MRGTLLNTVTVAGGAVIGLSAGKFLPHDYQAVALSGLGLVVVGVGIKMFLQSKNVLAVVASVAVGGVLGLSLGIQHGLDAFAEAMRKAFGGAEGSFNEGLITSSVLFCVGPMTLLGCLQDELEGKMELLAIKSTLDGIAAIFFAAALGVGVLFSAAVVLIVQGGISLLARPLRRFAADQELLDETSATGGILLLGIGLGLLDIKHLYVANYLPALVFTPIVVLAGKRIERAKGEGRGEY